MSVQKATPKPKKPTTKHTPPFTTLLAVYAGSTGITRYRFAVESGTKGEPPYRYDVNGDGTAPFCECRVRHPYARSCRLEDPAYALEMAERGRKAIEGVASR